MFNSAEPRGTSIDDTTESLVKTLFFVTWLPSHVSADVQPVASTRVFSTFVHRNYHIQAIFANTS